MIMALVAQKRGLTPANDDGLETDGRIADQSELAYGVTWDDVPQDAKDEALAQGIADYDDSEAWDADPANARTRREVQSEDPDATIFNAHWVKKPKMMPDPKNPTQLKLGGRMRWTPHGWQE